MRDGHPVRTRLEGLLGMPFADGNRVEALRNGDRIFPVMLDAIRTAETSVEFVTFIYWTGAIAQEMADALAERARAGVEVRVVLDAFGAGPMSKDLLGRMCDAGVDVRWFRPLSTWKTWKATHRTHRKVLVVDGRIGFTGGVGIAAEWEGDARHQGEWRDTHFRIEGPAVAGLRAAFFSNWAETDRSAVREILDTPQLEAAGEAAVQVVRSTACFGWSDIATVLDGLIALARERIRISTAYFAPDEYWVDALRRAVARGVEVEVMIPGPHTDKRVSELAGTDEIMAILDAGVRLYRFQPTMLHSKVALIDDDVVCIGSANFNQRSILKDDELVLVVIDRSLRGVLDRHYQEDLARCEESSIEMFEHRGPVRRLREWVARPVRSNV